MLATNVNKVVKHNGELKKANSNVNKKSILISTQYKLHNRSDIDLNRKSCALEKSDTFKNNPSYDAPYFDKLIHTL